MGLRAWFFRHDSCGEKHRGTKIELAALQESITKLQRRLEDLDDSCAHRFGRLFKRLEREKPADEELPAPMPARTPRLTAEQRFRQMGR